jgi:hypothetical protein
MFIVTLVIGTKNLILPEAYSEEGLGYLCETILTSGKLLLDTYFSISRKAISLPEIKQMEKYAEVGRFALQRLFCFKQRLLNAKRTSSTALKPHLSIHFPLEITRTGSLENTNTRAMEQKHVYIKRAYKHSSRRTDSTRFTEMHSRLETERVINKANDIFEELYGIHNIDRLANRVERNMFTITTGDKENEDVLFLVSKLSTDKEELIFDRRLQTLIPAVSSLGLRFLNPIISLESVWEFLNTNREIENFITLYKEKTPGITILNYKVLIECY